MAFEDLRGKAGTVVLTKGRSGLVVKPRVKGRNPQSPAQQAIRKNLARASAAYRNLTSTQVAAWKAYAASQVKTNPVSGLSYAPAANSVFTGFAAKVLQVNPSATIPTTPPTSAFEGDSITVEATLGTGKIQFTASAANTSGVTTEILLQPLVSPNRTPSEKAYRTKGFTAFASDAPFEVTVPAGSYAAAYRFVKIATGQQSPLVTLGTLTLTASLTQTQPKAA